MHVTLRDKCASIVHFTWDINLDNKIYLLIMEIIAIF